MCVDLGDRLSLGLGLGHEAWRLPDSRGFCFLSPWFVIAGDLLRRMSRRVAEPTGVELPDDIAVETQRIAAAKLEWRLLTGIAVVTWSAAFLGIPDLSGERLDRGGWQKRTQLGEVGAAHGAAKQPIGFTTKILEEIETDERLIGGIRLGAAITIRRPFRRRFGVDDIERAVDSDAQPEFMDRQALRPDARRELNIARLFIG